jgi:glucose/arabinose dehydrogenase
MFKRIFYSFMIFLSIVVFGLGLRFWWHNLRGIKPVVFPAPYDIGERIGESGSATSSAGNLSGMNETGMPLSLPRAFSISVFAKDLTAPRVMAFDPSGYLVVSIPSKGLIAALPDRNGDGKADETIAVADKLAKPHGVAFRFDSSGKPKLYVAEEDKITVFDYDVRTLKASMPIKIMDLPAGGTHLTRSIIFAPSSITQEIINAGTTSSTSSESDPEEEKLLVSIGSSCNVCQESDPRRASIRISDIDGTDEKVFASGLRNSVFMALHPTTGQLWATEMGRDLLGDDLPPDEINIVKYGLDYGWPYCYGKNTIDLTQSKVDRCVVKAGSYIGIPAHSAPLGLAFFPETGWPEEYRDDLLVAFHGSWNRTKATGYKIVRYRLDSIGRPENPGDDGQPMAEDFITGWLAGSNAALGRPADIKITEKGEIYVSDDKAGLVYRMTINGAPEKL